jgi:phage terminase large subunit-like protein
MTGLEVDPWQDFVIHNALGEADNGKWAAFEVGVEVARQNGKGGILEVRELAGLFILGERLLIHTAHEFKTSEEALERMVDLISGCPDLSRRVRTVKRSHGQEGIYLKSGQRLRYATRTKGGGRGFSADFVALDEAMKIPEAMHGALMPTLSARENPQLWYTGSAVDQESMDDGVVFARLRERAIKGEDPALAYFGWSP